MEDNQVPVPNASFEKPLMPDFSVPLVFQWAINFAFKRTQKAFPEVDLSKLRGFKDSFITRRVKDSLTLQQPVLGLWPNIRAHNFWSSSDSERMTALENDLTEAFDDIKAEVMAARKKGVQPKSIAGFPTKKKGDWTNLVVGMPSKANKFNKKHFPKILEVLEKHEPYLAVRGAEILLLQPNVELPFHTDGSNMSLALQMGLDVPDDCWLCVGNEERKMEERKIIFFDQSYVHTARNGSNKDRTVLFVQYYHPDISLEEIAAVNAMVKKITIYALCLFPFSIYYGLKVATRQKNQKIFSETEGNDFVKTVND